ncbi:hypothetical protein [Burkholderia lata]|uniref:Uncharacterized protein n=1 Tax=Burkholderia lata (strain ATCC 17760 / DSM 23089 / LMG 22485 / NCIMB 9086 / R18194 / 383) TaxID=482957 RepID=A0A6P2MPA6_BURL3|nr:hypothetical protein [Burkholderia lata]VWB83686.1 hypothetical protein BLA6863_03974 [Burkholderia lata]
MKNEKGYQESFDPGSTVTITKEMRRNEAVGALRGMVLIVILVALASIVMPSGVFASIVPVVVSFVIVAFPIKLILIYFPNRGLLIRCREKIVGEYGGLAVHQKLYVNCCIVTLAGTYLIFMVGKPFEVVYIGLMIAFYVYVIIYDGMRWYRAISDNLVGKAVIGVSFFASSNFAYSLAGQQIADIVHVTPTNFPRTIVFIAIATIPFIMVIIAGVVALFIAIMPVFFAFPLMLGGSSRRALEWLLAGTIKKTTANYVIATFLFQVMFYGVMAWSAYTTGRERVVWYGEKMSSATSWLIYNFDMYNGRECKIKMGAKIAPLGDAKFLVAHKSSEGEIIFDNPVKCDDLPAQPAIKE